MTAAAVEHAMDLAVAAGWEYQLLTFPNPAVGASCIGQNGEIFSVGAHRKAGGPHAEVYALRDAYTLLSGDDSLAGSDDSASIHAYLRKNHNNLFHNIAMAVTLEPCAHSGKTPSCALLIRDLGIKTVYISCLDSNPLAAGGIQALEKAGIKCVSGVCEAKGKALLEPFVRWQNNPFVFFKWAQRLDGTVDNGIISSERSRRHVHALRDRCDLIVIGGNTVRTDRPTLDARLVDGKAPDVLIYSASKEFDTTIPLFRVPGRNVYVENTLERIQNYSLVMVEGGGTMMTALSGQCDWYLCYIAPHIGGGTQGVGSATEEFEVLHAKISDDILLWMKKREMARSGPSRST